MPPYVLVLHGYLGTGPGHWQNWLAGELANRGATVDIPRLSDPDRPDIGVWLTELGEHVALAPRDAERVVLTHSLGTSLWLHRASRLTDRHEDHLARFDRALLVAPVGPGRHDANLVGFDPVPMDAAGVRRAAASTRIVIGESDPYCSVPESVAYARALAVDLDVIPDGGHLDAASGYGPWPSVRDWVIDGAVPIGARSAG